MFRHIYEEKCKKLVQNCVASLPKTNRNNQNSPNNNNHPYNSSFIKRSANESDLIRNQLPITSPKPFPPPQNNDFRRKYPKNQMIVQRLQYNDQKVQNGLILMRCAVQTQTILVAFTTQSGKFRFDIQIEDLHKYDAVIIDRTQKKIDFRARISHHYQYNESELKKNHNPWRPLKLLKNFQLSIILKDITSLKNFLNTQFYKNIPIGAKQIQDSNTEEIIPQTSHSQQVPNFKGAQVKTTSEHQKICEVIKAMTNKQKQSIVLDLFKVKKQKQVQFVNRKLKCPVFTCSKQFRQIQYLRSHVEADHPQLGQHGIYVADYDGSFNMGKKAMDLALYLGKFYPQQVKKIIKMMKTSQN